MNTAKIDDSMNNDNVFTKSVLVCISAILIALFILFLKNSFPIVIFLLGFLIFYFYILRSFDFWQRNIVILLAGYIILTRGFSYIGFRVGFFYVFIGEIIIFLSLTSCNFKTAVINLFKKTITKWLILWAFLGFVLSAISIAKYPTISILRDYAMVYYSIFVLFGYAFYKSYENLEIFYKILGGVFMLHAIWGLFYPFRSTIELFSPTLMGIVPLLSFRQDADSVVFMAGILYFLFLAGHYKWPKPLAFLLIAIQIALLLIFQVRAAFVGCLLVFLFLFIINRQKIMFKILIILLTIFTIGFVSNFSMPGRRGENDVVSATNILEDFGSIFNYNKAGTASFRMLWWKAIINDSLQSPKLLFFGRGFGPSLAFASYLEVGNVTRKDEEIGGLAKSPHSILITIFGRMGILGLFLWLGISYTFFSYMFKGIKVSKMLSNYKIHNILIWIAGFILMIIGTSIFGVLLESPFMAIPYFFFMGLGIAIVDKLELDYKRLNNENVT